MEKRRDKGNGSTIEKRRDKGNGCIYYREDKRQYEGRIKIGLKYNGKPIYKYVTSKKSTDVQRQLTSIRAQLDNGTYFEPSKMTLGSWLNEWMTTFMKMSVKEQTFNTYEILINKTIVPLIGSVKLKDLTLIMMQKMFNELAKSYEPSSLRKIKSILVMALRKAKENDLILKDPTSGIKLPKLPKTEIESMTVSDIDKFLNVAKNYNIFEAVVTGLGTGMRIGELLALKWADIDFEKAEIRVNKTLIRIRDEKRREALMVQLSVKTDTGNRTVPLSQDNVKLLKALRKQRMAVGFIDNDIVFCSKKGTHISFRNFNRALETICKKANVPRISANITRHTYATVAVVNKAELKTLADILGHKDVSTTYNNYVHPAKEQAKEVAELVNLSMKNQQ